MGDRCLHATAVVAAPVATVAPCGAARATLAALLLLSTTASALAELTIEQPQNDSLTTATTISVYGKVDSSDGPVLVRVGSKPNAPAEVVDGMWSIDLTLADGLNEVTATSGDQEAVVLVTMATMFIEPTRQAVFLRWSPETTEELRQILVETRQTPMTPEEQTVFAHSTKLKTREFIAANFSRFAIDIVDVVPPDDKKTHVIDFLPDAPPLLYGQSPHDCLNNKPKQVSEVYVGTLRKAMVSHPTAWAPMQKSDLLDTRITDVAHALARTASHELGHSLGLVTTNPSSICRWMRGCDLNHTCSGSTSPPALALRFDYGRYIMDDGNDVSGFARIAEAKSQSRGVQRFPATFNSINSDYLLLIHPP